jgi:hypothetical protein
MCSGFSDGFEQACLICVENSLRSPTLDRRIPVMKADRARPRGQDVGTPPHPNARSTLRLLHHPRYAPLASQPHAAATRTLPNDMSSRARDTARRGEARTEPWAPWCGRPRGRGRRRSWWPWCSTWW